VEVLGRGPPLASPGAGPSARRGPPSSGRRRRSGV
jgi:hypothetical protein